MWGNRVGVPMKDDVLNHSISKTEQLARLLLDRIIDSDLRPGDSFGTEAEMLAQFKVSRPTLRESIRILESHGVVRSEEHTSELQSLMRISYAVFCLKKKKI